LPVCRCSWRGSLTNCDADACSLPMHPRGKRTRGAYKDAHIGTQREPDCLLAVSPPGAGGVSGGHTVECDHGGENDRRAGVWRIGLVSDTHGLFDEHLPSLFAGKNVHSLCVRACVRAKGGLCANARNHPTKTPCASARVSFARCEAQRMDGLRNARIHACLITDFGTEIPSYTSRIPSRKHVLACMYIVYPHSCVCAFVRACACI